MKKPYPPAAATSNARLGQALSKASCIFFDFRYNVVNSSGKGDQYHLTGFASPPDGPRNRVPQSLSCRVRPSFSGFWASRESIMQCPLLRTEN